MTFSEKLNNYFKAGYGALSIQTHEEARVLKEIGKINDSRKDSKVIIYEWDCINGLRGLANTKVDPDIPDGTAEVKDLLTYIDGLIDDKDVSRNRMFVLKDFHMQLERQPIRINYIRTLRNLMVRLRSKAFMLVFLSPIFKIPIELEKEIQCIEYTLPDEEAISNSLVFITNSAGVKADFAPGTEVFSKSVEAAKGMTANEIDNAFALGLVESKPKKFGLSFVESVFSEKVNQIRKNGLLEHLPTDVTFDDVGGLEGIKNWIRLRKNAFTKEAKEFGIVPPKGILLAGIPGTGKTLIAKSIAKEFQCPLFKLDVGGLFSHLVGSTENNFRKAIQTMDSLGKCVVLIDEVEKSLNEKAVSGDGDTGVSSRSFGTFMTWMSERTSPIFMVMTSNDHTIMPPALLRRGRLDELFWVDLPNDKEREEIFKVQLSKRGRKISEFDVAKLAKSTNLFSGAEIEDTVKLALYRAFSEKSKLKTEHIDTEIKQAKPFAKHNPTVVTTMRQKAQNKLKIASESGQTEDLDELLRSIQIEG